MNTATAFGLQASLVVSTLLMAGSDTCEASPVAMSPPAVAKLTTAAAPAPASTRASKTPVSTLAVTIDPADLDDLRARALSIPVQGVRAEDLRDTFGDGRMMGGTHEALDIPAPMRTPVFAVEDGTVAKLFTSRRGGLTLYQFDPSRRYAYYYAHLDAYAPNLREGQPLKRCELLGYVGVTGNSPPGAPHLHFSIFKLEEDKRWWRGAPVNPHLVLRLSSAKQCPFVSR